MEAERQECRREPTHTEQLTAVAKQLEEARSHIRKLEEKLVRAKELLVIQANLGYETKTESEPDVPVTIQEEARREKPVVGMAMGKESEWEKTKSNF